MPNAGCTQAIALPAIREWARVERRLCQRVFAARRTMPNALRRRPQRSPTCNKVKAKFRPVQRLSDSAGAACRDRILVTRLGAWQAAPAPIELPCKPTSPISLSTRPRGREADAILRSCVHCGFCTATCPTYQVLGDELDGPRGRIYLIKQVRGRRTDGEDATAPRPLPHLPQL